MMRRDGCVGQLQVQSAQAAAVPLGFICGSLPVPTVNPASNPLSPTQAAALVPAINLLSQRTGAPRYRLLPTETDLNTAPSHGVSCDELLPVAASSHDTSSNGLCNTWEGGYLMQPLARKCESLAVSALTGYGDEIDVVAPVDILKQIFKTPYSKSRLSVAVHRVGHTLILNSGPDIEEGEKIARRKKSQAKAMEKNLFSKFVQHSVHDEGPDSPKTCDSSEGTPKSSTRRQPPGTVPPGFGSLKSSKRVPWQVTEDSFSESTSCCSEDDVRPSRGSKKGKQRVVSRRNGCEGGIDFQKSSKFMREQQQNSNFIPKDPDMPPRQSATENFLRVLFWQFQNLRMLLGSDLLLFSNEKHAAVSLHLMEIGRQVTPLMWLDAWLDNVMASIPELAVCYHRNGVVQGYELLKTDDIFLLKGLSEDGTAFFSPHVVQQNASSVLRFLQENCKQDPGTYWLFKNAGEDLMQLFDLSVISKTRNTCGDKEESECGTLPSSRNRGNGHYSLPLAMLLYRLANRLSRSQDPADRMKCAKLFRKCLEYMDEQEHLVIRASAHEHAARLILACYKQLGVMLQPLLLEDKQEAALELPSIEDSTVIHVEESPPGDVEEVNPGPNMSGGDATESTTPPTELVLANVTTTSVVTSEPVPHVVQALADPVSARLAAVHHLSQAIKSLRWQRQLQDVGRHAAGENQPNKLNNNNHNNYTECVCGEPECVAICDFRDIDVGFGMDEKLRKLLLLLGESYLTLGEAYKEDGQFSRALKAAEFACLTRGSTPRLKEDTSSKEVIHKGLFWGQVWGLVGDVFAEAQRTLGDTDVNIIKLHQEPGEELKMAQEVMKEVKRLKKKVGSCEICSLTSCSCQSDRASSGISASSSSPTTRHTRQKLHAKKSSNSSNTKSDHSSTAIVEAVVIEEEKRPEIFSYLRRSAEINDWEKNLSAASECYSAAVDAFADSTIHVQEYESALRKKGWACNELGRRRLAKGDVKSAEAAFETAIVAFRAVKDIPNVVLVYCNLAHGRRAAAEVFASQLGSSEELNNPSAFLTTVGEARFLYQEALEFYGEARKELLAVERTMQLQRGLCNEVYTQFAHTYLKLGMLLAREDKFLNTHPVLSECNDRKQAASPQGGMRISAKEAISKALVLYESLGRLRAQEAAYAQFQLGCQQRDSCLFVVQADVENNNSQIHKLRDSRLQGAKRLASMADRYWQKALEYYHADTHPDMFLQILMERSALCLAVAPASSHAGSEQALVHLLEGCRAVKFSTVSADITAAFTLQLQRLLKTMLGAALSASKPNGTAPASSRSRNRNEMNGSSSSSPSKANDVALLKQMYGCALKLGGGNDFGVLYSMWHT